MNNYNIHLLYTVIHKFMGLQIRPGGEAQAFAPGEPIHEENFLDISIQSTLAITPQSRNLQTHFQIDDIRFPAENNLGYRIHFCLLAIFDVTEGESSEAIKQFTQTLLPNLLAPLVSDNHSRFLSIVQPDVPTTRLQPFIPEEVIHSLIEQGKITYQEVTL